MKKEYEYYAFISYKRTDEKWAKWLQRKLETYRFPVTLRKDHQSLPKRLFPVFRDKTDLSSGMLWEELKKHLEESEYLIVVCSPESAQAPWVNEEVSYFQSLGRHDRIIPLIVSGEPHAADSSRECFCPALRSSQGDELLGVSIQELGKRNALLRVIASIMKIKYDQLAMRDKKRRRKRAALLTTLGALAAAATFAITWYNIPHTAYYWSYVYRNEVPEGFCKISKSEQKSAYGFFKIITQRGRVIRLENVNSLDEAGDYCFDENDDYGYPIIEFTYTQSGEIATAVFKDANDEAQLIKSYDGVGAVNLINPRNTSLIGSISSDADPQGILSAAIEVSETGPKISRILLDHDENGFLIRERYMWNNLNMPACLSNGFYGYQYTLNDNGKMIRQDALGSDFLPLESITACVNTVSYNERGQIIAIANFNAAGTPVLDDDCVHRYEFTYDASGSLASIKRYGVDGLPCNNATSFCEQRFLYDEQGLMRECSYFDENGQPTYSSYDGIHKIVYEYTFHDKQTVTKETYLDADGQPMYDNRTISSVVYTTDEQSMPNTMHNYDVDGNLTYYSTLSSVDSANISLWDEGAEATLRYVSPSNTAGMIIEYPDKLSQRITYLNTDNEPALNYFGYAITEITFNESGLMERRSFYDAEGKPIRAIYDAASILYRYNDASQLSSISYFDEAGQLCFNVFGAAEARILYDYSGKPSGVQYFDPDGNPCWVIGKLTNFSQYELVFDRFGQLSVMRYCTPTGDPLNEIRMDYDERGNCVSYKYYAHTGVLINGPDGYAIQNLVYDEYGRISSMVYLDDNGNYFTGEDGYLRQFEYDERGNTISRVVYSLDENGDTAKEMIVIEYDSKDNAIKGTTSCYVNEAPTDYFETKCEYDERNRLTKTSTYYNMEPTASRVTEYVYDACNRLITESLYLLADETYERYQRHEYGYDQYGFLSEEWYYDSDGNLYANEEGIAASVTQHDAMGNAIHIENFDSQKQLVYSASDGYAMTDLEYNSQGKVTYQTFYDVNGELMTRESGMPAYFTAAYDPRGYIRESALYDELGHPFSTDAYGDARLVYGCDSRGVMVYLAAYNEQNELVAEGASLVYIGTVTEGSNAEKAGLLPDDIILSYNDWNYFSFNRYQDMQFDDLVSTISFSTASDKDILICRVNFDTDPYSYDLLSFHIGAGPLGIAVTSETFDISYANDIKELYLNQFGSP